MRGRAWAEFRGALGVHRAAQEGEAAAAHLRAVSAELYHTQALQRLDEGGGAAPIAARRAEVRFRRAGGILPERFCQKRRRKFPAACRRLPVDGLFWS